MDKFEVTDAMVNIALVLIDHEVTPADVDIVPFDAMRAAIQAALNASGLVEENARLRVEVARLENLQEFWHGCVVLARRQLEEASQRLDKWIKERLTNDQ